VTVTDRGVSGRIDGDEVVVGHRSLFEGDAWAVSESLDAVGADAREAGRVPVYVGWDGAVRGVLVVGDEVREGWEAVVEDLAADGRRVVVLTGDSPAAARRFEEHPAIDETFAEVPPEAKAETVRRLTATERVAMVGDGNNDAPALAAADIGISVASGTDLAADAADAVLLEDRLSAIPELFAVTRGTNRRLKQNLGWAFVYNAVAIPMAVSGSSIHFSPRSRWGRAASSWCRTPREPFIKASSGRRRLRGCQPVTPLRRRADIRFHRAHDGVHVVLVFRLVEDDLAVGAHDEHTVVAGH